MILLSIECRLLSIFSLAYFMNTDRIVDSGCERSATEEEFREACAIEPRIHVPDGTERLGRESENGKINQTAPAWHCGIAGDRLWTDDGRDPVASGPRAKQIARA
jgi:hypothetical protein